MTLSIRNDYIISNDAGIKPELARSSTFITSGEYASAISILDSIMLTYSFWALYSDSTKQNISKAYTEIAYVYTEIDSLNKAQQALSQYQKIAPKSPEDMHQFIQKEVSEDFLQDLAAKYYPHMVSLEKGEIIIVGRYFSGSAKF